MPRVNLQIEPAASSRWNGASRTYFDVPRTPTMWHRFQSSIVVDPIVVADWASRSAHNWGGYRAFLPP